MRTTIEISEDQHRALSALANQRGLRGFSTLVREALDGYLADLSAEETAGLLALEGILDDEQEQAMRRQIEATRTTWRAS